MISFTEILSDPRVITGLIAIGLSLANGLIKSSDETTSAIGRFLRGLLDRLAVTTAKDAEGTIKLPLQASHKNGYNKESMSKFASKPASRSKKLNLLPLLIASSLLASSCACWGEKAQDPKCIVLKQVIDCTVGAGRDVIAHALPLIMAMISGGSMDFNALLDSLKRAGIDDASCILAAVETNFLPRMMETPVAEFVYQARSYRHLKAPGKRFKLASGVVVP